MVLSVLHGMVKCLPKNGQRKAADDVANDAHFPSANIETIYDLMIPINIMYPNVLSTFLIVYYV